MGPELTPEAEAEDAEAKEERRLEAADRRTRAPLPPFKVDMTHRETAQLLLGIWNGGGRDEIILMFRALTPLSAACVAVRLTLGLREQDGSELADLLENAH